MCLITNNKKPLVAQEDIKCYKLLLYYMGKYISPYIHIDYTKEVSTNGFMRAKGVSKPTRANSKDNYHIHGGYVHCFMDNTNGLLELCSMTSLQVRYYDDVRTYPTNYSYQIFECLIPKGTKYYANEIGGQIAGKTVKFESDVTDKGMMLSRKMFEFDKSLFNSKEKDAMNIIRRYELMREKVVELYNDLFSNN